MSKAKIIKQENPRNIVITKTNRVLGRYNLVSVICFDYWREKKDYHRK